MSATKNFRTDLTAANRGALRSATALGRVLTVAAAATTMGADGVKAGPKGGSVKAGAATITTRGGTTTIKQAGQKVVIDWDSFDIDAKEAVNFLQPGKDSIALNRVLNDLPTNIRGQLTANGNVWIVNQHGVTFHAGAVVNVGSLIATTADIDNADFMAGNYKFDKPGDPNAKIINEGDITFGEAGLAAFVAPSATNRGVIAGRMGKVVIAGNETFAVDLAGDGMWAFTMGEGANAASAGNSGRIHNPGGYILISARAAQGMVDSNISVGGVVEATTAKVEGGKIVLSGDGFVEVAGTLDATGAEAGQVGGSIEITGDKVHVTATAKIDASGDAGGGAIKIGGDYQGGGALKAAARTLVSEGAEIAASAIGQVGDGGEVIVWADEITGFFGSIRATGGANAGDGGFAEVSGKRQLAFDGMVDLSARNGLPGTLLLDPDEIVISANGADDGELSDQQILFTDGGPYSTFNISTGEIVRQLNLGTDLDLRANDKITLEAGNPITTTGLGELSLNAVGYGIYLNSNITLAGDLRLTTQGVIVPMAGIVLSARDVNIDINGDFDLGSITTSRDLIVSSTLGGVTDLAGETVSVTGATTITAARDIQINNTANSFGGAITLSGEDILFTDDGPLSFATITASANAADATVAGDGDVTVVGGDIVFGGAFTSVDDLTVTSTGAISQTAPITAADLATFNTSGGTVMLTQGGNAFGSVSVDTAFTGATVADVSITETDATELNMIDANALTINSGGAITDATGAQIQTSVSASLTTPNDITLDAAGNSFGSLSLSGANANILNLSDLTLGDVDLSGALVVNVTGGVTQGATSVVVDGTTNITAADDIALASSLNEFAGAVTLSGEDISIANTSTVTLTLGAITTADNTPEDATLAGDGDVTVAGGEIRFNGALNGVNSLTVNAAGMVSQGAALSITGDLDVNAAGQTVSLINGSNNFQGAVNVAAGSLYLNDLDALMLNDLDLSAYSTITAGTAITQSATMGTGNAVDAAEVSLTASSGVISLGNTSNDFGSVQTSATGSVLLGDRSGVILQSQGFTGSLTVNATGDISDDDNFTLTLTGPVYLSAGTGAITFDNENLDFQGVVEASGASVAIDEDNNLAVGAITASTGAASLSADDTLTINSGETVQGATVDLAANAVVNSGTITATDGGVDIDSSTTVTSAGQINATTAAAVVDIDAGGAVQVAGINAAGVSITTTSGDITQTGGTIATTEASDFTATGNVTINGVTNDFEGPVSVAGTQAAVRDIDGLELGDVNVATLTVNAAGAITQAASTSLTVTSSTSITTGADILLANTANAVAGSLTLSGEDIYLDAGGSVTLDAITASNAASDTTIAGAGDVTISGGSVAFASSPIGVNDLDVIATGEISQTAVISITGDADLSAAMSQINLGNADNDFQGHVDAAASAITLYDRNNLELGLINADTLVANAGANITDQGAKIEARNFAGFTATGDIDIDEPDTHVFTTGVDLSADQIIRFAASGTLSLGSVTTSDVTSVENRITATDGITLDGVISTAGASDLTLETTNGDILKNAGSLTTDVLTVDTGTGDATFITPTIDVNTLRVTSGGNVSLTTPDGLTIGDVDAAALTVSAADVIDQEVGSSIVVSGLADFTTTGDTVKLIENGNNFGSVAVDTTGGMSAAVDVEITDANGLALGDISAASLTVIAGGDVTQVQTTTISVAGTTTLTVTGGGVALEDATNDFATVTGSANSIALRDTGDISLGTLTANTGSATVLAGGGVTVTSIDANAISIETTNGAITQTSGAITTADGAAVSDFTATGDVTLNQASNDFGGPVGFSGQTVTIRDTDALILDDVAATGTFIVNAGGAISQNGASSVTVTGTATITATGQNIDLSNDNDFRSTFVATGADVKVTDAGALELGAISASTLTVEAGGAVSQSAAATVANETTVTAIGQAVDLDNTANAFTGVVNVTGGAVEIVNNRALGLGDITASSLVASTPTGNVTNAADDVLSVTGTTSITSTTGSVTIASDSMNSEDLGQTVTLSAAGDVSLTGVNSQKLVLGDVTSDTGTVTVNISNQAIDLTGNVNASTGGDAVTLRSAGVITQIAGAISASELTVSSSGNTVSLTTATNDVDTLTLGVNGTITVVEADGLAIRQETGGSQGALTLRSTGAITQASSLTVTNNAGFVTEGASITLNAAGNAFGSVSADTTYNMAAGNSVTINEADATVISGIAATSATVTSGGAISQTGAIDASGGSSFTATGDINLTDAANDFADTGSGSTAAFSGATVNVTDVDTLALGNIVSSASTTITADDAGASGSFSGGLTELRFFDADGDMVVSSALALPTTIVNFTADSVGSIDAQSLTLPNANTLLDATTSVTFSTGAGSFSALTVNAPDGISQTAAITVSGATDLNAPASQIDLGNSANDFQGRVDADGSAVTLYDASSLELALINSDTLVANARTDITDQGAKIEARNFASFTALGDITIDAPDTHVFNGSVSLSADQIAQFSAKGPFSFGAITATNTDNVTNQITVTGGATLDGAVSTAGLSDLTLSTTDGNILQSSGSLATDVLTLNLGTGDGTFIAGVNDVNTLTAPAATSVALTDTDGLTIGTVDATTLTVTAGGEIDQQAMSTVVLTGLATLTTAGQNITLAEASNDFAVIDAEGGDLTFRDATGVELADIDATGALTVEAMGGDITDGDTVATPADADINVAGTTALTATGAITMDDATNDFVGAVSASGAAITLRDANSIILGDIDANGALIVDAAAGAITQNGDGAIGEDIDALATATFSATDAITLTDASNDFRAGVNVTGDAVSLVDLNAIELTDIDAGSLAVTAARIDDGASSVAGADVNVTGETALTASTTITLDDATNDFGGAVSASGGTITLRDANSITLGDIDAGGVLTVEALTGAISQDGDGLAGEDINAAAEANFTASTTITLTDASNDFLGVVNASGTDVAIRSLGELQLGDIDSTSLDADAATITDGATSIVAGDDINVTGTATLNAAGTILLNDATNDFGQAVSFTGQDVTLTDANSIVLGEGAVGGTLEVTAAGSITDSAGSSVSVGGATALTAQDGAATFDIALDNDTVPGRHDFGGAVTAIGQDITLIDRSGITLGTVTTSSGAADDTINVDGGAEATDPGELIVIARGGAITQDGASVLTVTGDTTLEATDGVGGYFDITLTNTQNAFDSDNADAAGDGDATPDRVTFLGETVAITDAGPFLVFDSVANAGGVLTSQTGDLTIERLRVNAATGPLVGIAVDGAIDADDLSGGSITLGGAGSTDGAATAASGIVTVDNFSVGALAVASDVSTTLTNGDAGGGLKVAAPLQTFTFVTADAFTDGAATDFNALTGSTADQLILERIAFDGDITIAAGDVDLGHIDADDGFNVTALTGDVTKRADADLDFGGSATTGFAVAGARGAADQAVALQGFDTLLRVGGAASFTATSGDVVITRGQTGSGAKNVDLQGAVSIAATDAAIEDQNSLVLGQVSVANDLAIRINTDNADGTTASLTQTDAQTITVGGDLALITGLGGAERSDVSLTTAGNDLNTVSALADDVSLVSGAGFTFRNSDLTGGLTLSSGGDLTIQDVQVDGETAFDAAGATTLNRLNVNGVTGQSGGGLTAAELIAGGAVELTTTGGNLTVTDAIIGAFDFDSAGALTVTNLSTAGSEGGLSTAVGDIAITNIVSASNASFDSTGGALDIDSARIGSTLTLSASGDVTLGAIATGANLSATSDTASVLIRDGASETPADIVVDGVQGADIGFASGPLIGDLADDRIFETVPGASGQTVDPADFTLQLAIGGDAAFAAAGSILLPREAAEEGGFQNDFMGDVALSATTGNVVIEDANALSFATVTITTGDLTARSNADNIGAGEGISQTAAIAVGGDASFITGDHGDNDDAAIADETILADVTLGSQANDFTGAVSVIAANASLADVNSIAVADTSVTGTLTVDTTAAGPAEIASLSDVQSGGATTVTSGGSVDLDRVTVGGALTATGQGAGLTANDIDVTGATTLTAETTLAVDDAILADATITAGASGALSDVSAQVINVQTGGVTISGLTATTTTITATDGPLTLTQAEIDGPLVASAGEDITIDTTRVDGDAAILSSGGDIGLGSFAVSGQLTAESAAGAIRTIDSNFAMSSASASDAASPPAGDEANSTLISVGGDAYFLAAGDIALVDDTVGVTGDNDFMGGLTAISGGSVILTDANDLILGAPTGVARPGRGTFRTTGIIAAESLRVEVGGMITDADAPQAFIEIGGDALLRAGGDILLDNETHDIGGAIAARGQNITLTEVGSVNLGRIDASGDLLVEAGANNDAQGGTLLDAAIIQDRAVDVANAVIGESSQVETSRGAIRVEGVSTFTTGLAPGFALDNPQVTGARDLVLDSPANQFGGRLNVARIAGDATITENSQLGATTGDQQIGNFEIGGTTRLTTTDNIVFLGRMSGLADEDTPDGLPTRPNEAEVRNQGNLNIADEDLHLFIATGEALIIDTRGADTADGKVNPAGADVRFDGFVDGDNNVLPLGGPSITSDREGLGGLTVNAGSDGEIRFRDFVGAVHPLGDVSLFAGDIFAGFTFETLQPDLLTANFTPDNRFLFDRLAQDDFFFARNLEVKAQGRIEFLTPFRTVENFVLLDQYFGVNIAGLVFGGLDVGGRQVGPEIVQSFGFVGNDRSRATGLFPRGPQGGNFQFNDCVIGDVADCTNIPIPNVINNILTPAPPLLGIDTEDLLELFGSFGNEELWGVPQSYYSDLGADQENKPASAKASDDDSSGS